MHQQQADGCGVTLANRGTTLLKPGMLYLVANEDRHAPTRYEGIQQLYRTEPRSSPVQSFRFRIGVHQPQRGFFEVNDPRVQLLVFKPAEARARWYVLRFQENGGKGVQGVRLTTPFRISAVVRPARSNSRVRKRLICPISRSARGKR